MRKFLAFFISLSIALVACTPKSAETGETRTVFRYNEAAGIASLDPIFASKVENIWAVNQLYNGLIQMDDELQIQPCIAKSWDISEDGLTYSFHLRTDVYFHDDEVFEGGKGRKVVASDFVHSLFRILNPDESSPGLWIFNNIDRTAGKGFEALNDSTLEIHLLHPFPPFLGLLTMQYCSVVPFEATEKYGRDFRSHPVGTGPFKFKIWKEGAKLVFIKNDNYFEKDDDGNSLPYLDAVTVSFLSEKQVVFLEFSKGTLDMVSGLDQMPKDEVLLHTGALNPLYKGKFRLETLPYLKTDYLGILVDPNSDLVKNSPLKLKAVRQAINYGIDRQQMITYLRNNIGAPANSGIVPRGMPSFDAKKVKGYTYNPDRATALLNAAGFNGNNELPEITITTSKNYREMCEFMQHQLGEIGIKIKIDVQQAINLSELIATARVNLFRKNWLADYPDAENFLALFYSRNFSPVGPNYTHFSSEEYDELYEKAQLEVNDTIRFKYYQQMDQIIIEEAPIVPLYYDDVIRLVHNNISGLSTNPMNLLTLKRVKKENNPRVLED
ncbi:MAG TPA: ABC transporter substrate-binding protein [Flavobacteriales bacterium]|nr:ABC transporter substrate-binding protein [Flavobacteriales bacterium]HIO68535.1 ABC transporter substrate-binding protein [Flavobacteriales bacterium]